jgi:hypothetical protein
MGDAEFVVLLVLLLWIWWIVPRRKFFGSDAQKILNALERIETKLGTNPELNKPPDPRT